MSQHATSSVRDRLMTFPANIAVPVVAGENMTRLGIVTPGERGYAPMHTPSHTGWTLDELDAFLIKTGQAERAPTPQEREAAMTGSMFGWDTPAADPARYTTEEAMKLIAAHTKQADATWEASTGETLANVRARHRKPTIHAPA